jgi:hypothetical protein
MMAANFDLRLAIGSRQLKHDRLPRALARASERRLQSEAELVIVQKILPFVDSGRQIGPRFP